MQVLIGENKFTLYRELELIQKKYLKSGSLTVDKIYPDQIDFKELSTDLNNLSLFDQKKIVILYDPFDTPGFDLFIENYLKYDNFTNELIIIGDKIDKRKRYFQDFQKKSVIKFFPVLAEGQLSKWVEEYLQSENIIVDKSMSIYIVRKIGNNQFQISNHLQKIILSKEKISRQLIDSLIEEKIDTTIFELIDACFNDKNKVIKFIDDLIIQNIAPEQMIALLAWQIHIILIIKFSKNRNIYQLSKETGVNTFALEKSAQLESKISLLSISDLIRQLRELDILYKTKEINLVESLKNLLIKLSL